MNRCLCVLILSALSVRAETYGDWEYWVQDGVAAITGYSGSGGAVVIPSEVNGFPVKTIGSGFPLFDYDENMVPLPIFYVTSILIPDSVTKIEKNCFQYLGNLRSVNIPSGVTSIGEYTFDSCGNLGNIAIPNSVTSIGNRAFSLCNSFTTMEIPDSVSSLGTAVFAGCGNLKSVKLGNGITNIPDGSFRECAKLETVNINNNTKSIGSYAFYGTKISNVIIPTSVTNVGNLAFASCGNLTTAYFLGNAPQSYSSGWESFTAPATVYVLPSSTGWGSTYATVPIVRLTGIQAYNLGQQSIIANPNQNNLYSQNQFSNSYSSGQQSVLNSPNSYNLYTSNQIHNLGFGGIVLDRNTNNQLSLNYQILQSADLQNWTPYQSVSLPITNAPPDKMFLRFRAAGQ